jgi:calcineurin-like phosphoesterase family protein
MKTWFTSDTHFGHTNIIDYCKRPFNKTLEACQLCHGTGERTIHSKVQGKMDWPCSHPDVELHDQTIIRNWNARVAPDDLVYHLGDFAFGNFAKIENYARWLNGKKVLIRGNHDRLSDSSYARMGFLVRKRMLVGSIHMQHHPPPWNEQPRGVWLCGHVHDRWQTKELGRGFVINVGVDVRGFQPVSMEELGLSENFLS